MTLACGLTPVLENFSTISYSVRGSESELKYQRINEKEQRGNKH